MEQIHYDRLQETIYHEVMDNGLQVYVLPKPTFKKPMLHLLLSTVLLTTTFMSQAEKRPLFLMVSLTF